MPAPLVGELVQLADYFLARLPRVELQGFERRTLVLFKPVSSRNRPPRGKNVVAEDDISGKKVPEPREFPWRGQLLPKCLS